MRKVIEADRSLSAAFTGALPAKRRISTRQGAPTRHNKASGSILKACAVGLVLMVPAGCSMTKSLALDEQLASEPEVITASVAKPVKAEGIDSTDAEMIKTVVAESDQGGTAGNALAWSNPDTGSSGTIMAIDKFVGSHGQKCKKFQTTVDTFMGISLYDGETCELRKGFWVLSWFMRKDG